MYTIVARTASALAACVYTGLMISVFA